MAECETPAKALDVLRSSLNFTNEQFGDLIGLKPSTISVLRNRKSGMVPFEHIVNLCEVLRISYTHTTPDGVVVSVVPVN